MKTNRKGEVATVVLIVLGLLGASQLVPNFRPSSWFKKAPPTKELAQAQEALAKAQAEAKAAQDALKATKDAADAKEKEQVGYAQEMLAGVPHALKGEPQTPGVRLAISLSEHASNGLSQAIGGLSPAKQAEILHVVDLALSGKQAEIDEANRALSAKDTELRIISKEKASLEGQIPTLQARIKASEDEVATKTLTVTQKAQQVVDYAAQVYAKEQEAGSLSATVDRLLKGALILGGIYLFVVFFLPGLVKHLNPGWLKTVLRDIAGFSTSPLLYMDARKKLTDLTP